MIQNTERAGLDAAVEDVVNSADTRPGTEAEAQAVTRTSSSSRGSSHGISVAATVAQAIDHPPCAGSRFSLLAAVPGDASALLFPLSSLIPTFLVAVVHCSYICQLA